MRKFLLGFLLTFAFCTSGFASFAGAEPVYNPEILAGPEYNFRKTTWGMTREKVMSTENKKPDDVGSVTIEGINFDYLTYFDIPFHNYTGQLVYLFHEGELVNIDIHFFDHPKIGKELASVCTSIWGQPTRDEYDKDNDVLYSYWELNDTKILLISYLTRSKSVKTPGDATLRIYRSLQNN